MKRNHFFSQKRIKESKENKGKSFKQEIPKYRYITKIAQINIEQPERVGRIQRFFLWLIFGVREEKI